MKIIKKKVDRVFVSLSPAELLQALQHAKSHEDYTTIQTDEGSNDVDLSNFEHCVVTDTAVLIPTHESV